MQKMIKFGRRVVPEGAPVEEEQDKVHHRPPISDSGKSLHITWLTQRELLRSPGVFSSAINFIHPSC